ncbi:hypothetical protein [Pseudomonas sp. NIBRBAC000502773]|uniref:hypothetical protein n=1 Tax=Pseudomonas sp. NIBRBAC000502773 TaxID=2590776 RepID=UPI001131F793|nr:hypothetical protein [Pseudomonas sp. NIBRBAC000502773]QDG58453.1 hypothetical protein NIBR502773_18600 [Pseudomonas sp. NIBRBAC000502773]
MNITKALWIATACTLTSIAGCTNGQGPTNIQGTLQVTNSSRSNMTVIQGADIHSLRPDNGIELPINTQRVTVTPTNSNADRIDRVELEFNPGQCPYSLCLRAR